MPKTKRFKNLQKSVQSASSSKSTDAAPDMTSLLAPSFPTTSHPTPSCQATSLPSPSFQATRQQTASFQATTQPRQQALSFQAMGQTTPCIQPTPSFQATGQTTLSFQATTQTTPSFQPPINPTPTQATSNKRPKRESSHHWTVDEIDSHGNTKRLKLKTREALSLPQGERVVVEFDGKDPIGEAQGLLAGVCGLLATDCTIFPIGFDKWPDMPKSYFNDCFNNIIKV
ncbi:PREDICTED: uncharacterized protein LOC109230285 [Nicotiana attenuata]|uniref:uncharacterized protein LOC109230285 n=1 Tax=Nicotiana attenuata TaxID=49451 RepID=UPI0009059BDC|nr:PREDICTED: uncharacterized protein LOC109230285 [Nicotiana attenuata]